MLQPKQRAERDHVRGRHRDRAQSLPVLRIEQRRQADAGRDVAHGDQQQQDSFVCRYRQRNAHEQDGHRQRYGCSAHDHQVRCRAFVDLLGVHAHVAQHDRSTRQRTEAKDIGCEIHLEQVGAESFGSETAREHQQRPQPAQLRHHLAADEPGQVAGRLLAGGGQVALHESPGSQHQPQRRSAAGSFGTGHSGRLQIGIRRGHRVGASQGRAWSGTLSLVHPGKPRHPANSFLTWTDRRPFRATRSGSIDLPHAVPGFSPPRTWLAADPRACQN